MNVTRNTVIGKCLRKGREAAQFGLCKVINNGSSTRFWEDSIAQIGCLRSLISGPLNRNNNEVTFRELVTQNGEWNQEIISFILPTDIRQRLQAIPVDTSSPIVDNVSWIGNLNGNFSTKSAYFLLCSFKFSWPEDSNWSWVWKLGCHPRYKLFIWLLLMNGLPTRGNLAGRGMNISSNCPLCNLSVEENSYLFRDCIVSQQVWLLVSPYFALQTNSDFNLWIKINCKDQAPSIYNISHETLFIYLILHLWNARNKKIFENCNFSVASIVFLAKGKAGELSFLASNDVRGKILLLRSILSRFERSQIQHVHRERNYCVDFLAKKASTTICNLVSIQHALSEMYPLLLADCLGIESLRRTSIGLCVLNSDCIFAGF
ncbi:reverse transcriptase [Senna tora]|uniref:Reverse transcriptase n=1 Tax=Senna tora TaxID=362788 RepID=A0A835CLI3_9FABA|nr:reverse transcriptase [Senna tora]